MNYEEANQILNNVKFGMVQPVTKITEALIVTGDLNNLTNLEHKLIQTGFLDDTNRNFNPPWITGPSDIY